MSTLPSRPQSAACLAKTLLLFLLPTFLSDLLDRTRRRTPPKLHATSYLDGLRGLAACAVFAYHYTDYNHKLFLPAYGYNAGADESSLLQLPYIRLIYSGAPMVHIFFVISGFALSFRPLRCLYDPDAPAKSPPAAGVAKCQGVLASSAFRRPIRLFMPPLAVTAIVGTIVQMGYMNKYMEPKETAYLQFLDWYTDALYKVTWPWAWDDGSPRSRYNPHLWTIPLEFTHSIFLFLVLLVLSRLRGFHTRRIVLVMVMVYCLSICRWAAFEFLAGAFLADSHLSRQFHKAIETDDEDGLITPLPTLPRIALGKGVRLPIGTILRVLRNVLRVSVLVAAGYLLCWPPRNGDYTPSFTYIQSLAPASYIGAEGDKAERGKNFWLALAAFSTVWSCSRIRLAKRLLTTPLAQYAGRVSFCLYIFQHMVLNLMQHHVLGSEYKAATKDTPEELAWGIRGMIGISTPLQRTVTWFAGLVVMGSVLVWMADLFTRVVDGPAVRLARRVEGWAFAPEERREEALLEK